MIFAPDFSAVYAVGYNGPAADEPESHCLAVVGDCGCIHAEVNALVKLSDHVRGAYLYTTCCPCKTCAGLIVNVAKQGRVSRVIYRDSYRTLDGQDRIMRSEHVTIVHTTTYEAELC